MAHVSTIIEDNDEKVELFLSCRGLKTIELLHIKEPQVKVYIDRQGHYTHIGTTEAIQGNMNPQFTKTFVLDYMFEMKQKLMFEVVSENDSYGTVEATLGEVVGSKNMTGIFSISHKGKVNGKLIIKAEKIRENNSVIDMTVSAKGLTNVKGWFGKSNPVFKLCRMAGDSGFVSVYESEVVKKNLNPEWNPLEIKVRKACNGDYDRPIKIEVYSRSKYKDTFIGECQFSVNEVSNFELKAFTLVNPKKNGKKAGTFYVDKFQLKEKPSFLDYLKGGSQLAVMVGVDFTGSNGDPISPDSLHAFKYDGTLNEYQTAMLGVCDILLHYDSDKKVPMFGFGGKPKFPTFATPSVSHCFSLTGDQTNPWAYGLDGIMQVYYNALQNVELSGPTLFSPILQTAMKIALQNKNEGSNEYTILLILTDGEIHDMEQTINALIKSAQLPLSVIIVGVGKADFTNMIILDGDEGLYNAEGVKAQRDLVQFVPFRDFKGSPELLAKHVLEEIPTQVVEYYTSMGIKPKPPQPVDLTRLLRAGTLDEQSIDYSNSGVPASATGGINNTTGFGANATANIGNVGSAAHEGKKMFTIPENPTDPAHFSNISFYATNKKYGNGPTPQQNAQYVKPQAQSINTIPKNIDFERMMNHDELMQQNGRVRTEVFDNKK